MTKEKTTEKTPKKQALKLASIFDQYDMITAVAHAAGISANSAQRAGIGIALQSAQQQIADALQLPPSRVKVSFALTQ